MKHLILSIAVLLASLASLAQSSSPRYRCNGTVQISAQETSFSSNVNLIVTTFKVGDHLNLWAPITLDIESGMSLTIRDVKAAYPGGTIVYATYDQAGMMGFISFYVPKNEEGKILIKQFSGFEAGTPFGPTDLQCEPLK